MSKIIEAETARLAGLQIDFLQKLRDGQLTLDQTEWWINQTSAERDRLSGNASASKDKGPFVLLSSARLTVPTSFVHQTQIASFLKAHRREFSYVNDDVTDANFAKATQRLIPGRTYTVKIFWITRRVSSPDCLGLYKDHNGILTGAQGLTLAYQEMRGSFPVGKWLASFDEKDALPVSDGDHRVPGVDRYAGDYFKLSLGYFEYDWYSAYCILVFCDC